MWKQYPYSVRSGQVLLLSIQFDSSRLVNKKVSETGQWVH